MTFIMKPHIYFNGEHWCVVVRHPYREPTDAHVRSFDLREAHAYVKRKDCQRAMRYFNRSK